jgi:hypothetical protein
MVANFDVCKRYEKVLASAAFAPCSPAPVGTVPSRLRGEVADGEAADGTGELWTVVSFHMTTTGVRRGGSLPLRCVCARAALTPSRLLEDASRSNLPVRESGRSWRPGCKHLAQRWQHWSHRGSVAVR